MSGHRPKAFGESSPRPRTHWSRTGAYRRDGSRSLGDDDDLPDGESGSRTVGLLGLPCRKVTSFHSGSARVPRVCSSKEGREGLYDGRYDPTKVEGRNPTLFGGEVPDRNFIVECPRFDGRNKHIVMWKMFRDRISLGGNLGVLTGPSVSPSVCRLGS